MGTTRALLFGLLLVACSGRSATIDGPGESVNALNGTKPPPTSGGAGAPTPSTPTGPVATTPPPATTSTSTEPRPDPPPPPPVDTLEVSASIISATLGEDCPLAMPAREDQFCAPSPDGLGCGPLPCTPSSLQLSFKSGDGPGKVAKIAITQVVLYEAKSGTKLEALTASGPKAWAENGYASWDETLKASSDLKASYDLSSPTWSKLGDRFDSQYRLFVTLRIDGTTVTLESPIIHREPIVDT